MTETGPALKKAAGVVAVSSTDTINACILTLAQKIRASEKDILAANQKDLDAAKDKDLKPSFVDRLILNAERIESIAKSVEDIAALDDPSGIVLEKTTRPNGLVIEKISVPIGVLGVIYESRPNVTVDAAALCLKAHNAVLLRGGSESIHSARALHVLIEDTLEENGLPKAAVSMVPSVDRALVGEMLAAREYVDVIVPRGGRGLIERVMQDAAMPVFAHLDGNCHVYIDKNVDSKLALEVLVNAKLRRTGICGAAESLLLHAALNDETKMALLSALLDQDVEVRGCTETQKIDTRIKTATDADWGTEYLDKIISCKIIPSLDEAITHINTYGSHHTDSILTSNPEAAQKFLAEVDSAIVIHNASTQFADGGEFGMGAEIGIGTGKLHARGPVGLKQLVTFKYKILGNGQTRP